MNNDFINAIEKIEKGLQYSAKAFSELALQMKETDQEQDIPQIEEDPRKDEATGEFLGYKSRSLRLSITHNFQKTGRLTLWFAHKETHVWTVYSHIDVHKVGNQELTFENVHLDDAAPDGIYIVRFKFDGKAIKTFEYEKKPRAIRVDKEVDTFDPRSTTLDKIAFWDFGKEGNVRTHQDLKKEFSWGLFWGYKDPNHPKANPGEWQIYQDFSDNNFEFSNNSLSLVAKPIKKKLAKDKITSGLLRSKVSFSPTKTKSIVMALRCKIPAGKGLWPAWWAYPKAKKGFPRGKSELDMFEVVNKEHEVIKNHEPIIWHSNFHSWTVKHKEVPAIHFEAFEPLSGGWTNWLAIWSYESVSIYLDGQLRRVINIPYESETKGWGKAAPAEMLINLAVGGGWPGPADDPNAYPAKMVLDYAGIWSINHD